MKYRKLGNTGLIVSEVALGTMQFGGKMNMGNLDQEVNIYQVHGWEATRLWSRRCGP